MGVSRSHCLLLCARRGEPGAAAEDLAAAVRDADRQRCRLCAGRVYLWGAGVQLCSEFDAVGLRRVVWAGAVVRGCARCGGVEVAVGRVVRQGRAERDPCGGGGVPVVFQTAETVAEGGAAS